MSIVNPLLKNGQQQVDDPFLYTNNVVQTIFSILFIIGVIYFIWNFLMGAFRFINQGSDPQKVETARNQLTNSFLGLVIMFLLFAILKFIGYVTGIKELDTLVLPWPTL